MKIQLSNNAHKVYGLADSKGEFYVDSLHDDGSIHMRLSLRGFDKGNGQNIRMHNMNVGFAEVELKKLSTKAPIEVDITYDSNIINDQEKKSDILSRLTVVELLTQSSVTMRSLTGASIKKAKEEETVKSQVSSIITRFAKNVGSMPVEKCKKIQELLAELN